MNPNTVCVLFPQLGFIWAELNQKKKKKIKHNSKWFAEKNVFLSEKCLCFIIWCESFGPGGRRLIG